MSGNHYTKKEDDYLCNYIAEFRPNEAGRQGNTIYKALVENADKWPWGKTHSWQGWRDRYRKHKEEFDHRIRKLQRLQGIQPNAADRGALQPSQRVAFTDTEDKLLVQYLARYNPQFKGRNGNEIYKQLVENKDKKWNWSKTHSWHSWRHRYASRQDSFDRKIGKHIERHNIPIPSTPRPMARVRDAGRPAKRQKTIDDLDTQEEQLANLVVSTPALQEKKSGGTRIKEEPIVKREPLASTVQVNGARSPYTLETVKVKEENDNSDSSEDDDEVKVPPGSEDYGGDIFEDAEEAKVEISIEPRSGGETGDEGDGDQDVKPSIITNSRPNPRSQQPPEVPAKNKLYSSAQVVEKDRAFQLPSKLPPPKSLFKPRPRIDHNSFTLSSQSRRPQDDDPFHDSPSPAAKPKRTTTAKKCPPTLKEGPYGNHLNEKPPQKADEGSNEDSDADVPDAQPTWPPQRGGTRASQMSRENEVKERLEYQTERRRGENGKAKAAEEGVVQRVEPQEDVQHPTDVLELLPDEVLEPTKPRTSRQAAVAHNVPDTGPSQTISLERTRTDIFAPPPHPKKTPATKRHSAGDATDINALKNIASLSASRSGTRTINLRKELANRNLNQPIRRPSSRASYTSHASGISEDDSSILQELGVQMAIQKFSQEFGFTEVIVRRLWNDLRSLRLLKDALVDMKESAERRMSEWVEGAFARSGKSISRSPTTSITKSQSELMLRYISTTGRSVEPASAPGSSSAKHRRRSSVDVGGRSLEIRPVDPLEASAAMEVEYEPLTGTRAGKYARLVKLGREDEALEREQRRVSSVAYSPRRSEVRQEDIEEAREADDQGEEGSGEVVEDEVGTGFQDEENDEENQAQDEDMPDVPKQQDVPNREQNQSHADNLGEHDMDVDSSSERRPSNHDQRRKRRYELNEDSHEQEASSQRHQPRETDHDHRQSSEDDFDDEELISIKSESPEDKSKIKALTQKRTDAERWQEVEHLFLAANHEIVEDLREIEKGFNPSFMMRWIANQVVMI